MNKVSDESKQKPLTKPLISCRLPKAFSQASHILKKKSYEDIEGIEEHKKLKKLLSPIKLGPKEHSSLTKALKKLEKIPINYDDKSFELFLKKSSKRKTILPHCQVQLEEMITLSHYPSQSLKGSIKKVLHAPTLALFTVKQMPISTVEERTKLKDWIGQWQNFQKKCKFLVNVSASFWNSPEGCVSVIADHMHGGSLSNLLHTLGAIPEKPLAYIAKKVLKGLAFFHCKNEIYGGISPTQILFSRNGHVKLSLGLTKRRSNQVMSIPNDIYALGQLLLTCLCGGITITEDTSPQECCLMHSLGSDPFIDRLSSKAKSFLCLCLQHTASRRPSAVSLLEHEWLNLSDYPGPLVDLPELISLNFPYSAGECCKAAEDHLSRICEAIKLVLMGQAISKPSESMMSKLALDLGLPIESVEDKIHKVYNDSLLC
ncbi:unnamed protein product [Blepharisma stoltei]|uniref:mitogen-activated protein kinase kinase n=1 Tax=Blepharisma stoltei TaxID=1481888 RepID=A0AAU9J7B2_9CILI|nr:unnamed protein product [Blepharisma stoltei]